MDKDVQFALAVLREEYKKSRITLVKGDLVHSDIENVLYGLEIISAAIIKIEYKFEGDSE